MRKDIEIHIKTGDVAITPHNRFVEYPFRWVENPDGLVRYIYGEIEVPSSIPENTIRTKGLFLTIPYTARYKEFYIRVKRVYSETNSVYMHNPVDGSDWFLVKHIQPGKEEYQNAFVSKLRQISESSFRIMFDKGVAVIYSAFESDFNVIDANRQNMNLMLACVPTNNYRYPISGVGLIRWVKSNVGIAGLADILTREFEEDGTPVLTADYDYETNQLQLELDTSNVD